MESNRVKISKNVSKRKVKVEKEGKVSQRQSFTKPKSTIMIEDSEAGEVDNGGERTP